MGRCETVPTKGRAKEFLYYKIVKRQANRSSGMSAQLPTSGMAPQIPRIVAEHPHVRFPSPP